MVLLLGVFLSLACLGTPNSAQAEDHILTIGGGYSPTGNQVSLEKNVLYFRRMLEDLGLSGLHHDVFFADGDSPGRDLQFTDPEHNLPKANELLARLFEQTSELGYEYRSHQVAGLRGASTRDNIERWFAENANHLQPGDRLIVYFTGHGGKGKKPENSHLYLWNQEQIPVEEFTRLLDKLAPDISVVLVMVQCYSGGFANSIFNSGDSAHGCSDAERCGFFATTQDRSAAGCTPDIDEENYQEYSSHFWAALSGRSRIGEPVELPDFDGDGRISFVEAHAHALLASDTIDISVKTSDAFLRAYSKTSAKGVANLLTVDSPYAQLLAVASPADRAVLEGLSTQLQIEGENRAAAVRDLAEKIGKQRKEISGSKGKLTGSLRGEARKIRATLLERWPELANRWNPAVQLLLEQEPGTLVAAIEGHAHYSEFARLQGEVDRLSQQHLDLERQWVKCQRFLRVAENVALANNLPLVGTPEQVARFERLMLAEGASLTTAIAESTPTDSLADETATP
ncbi:MAG: caspase family protein [Pirellulales bacterium]|nr:caspase family protein [Pirellulales bacterium]